MKLDLNGTPVSVGDRQWSSSPAEKKKKWRFFLKEKFKWEIWRVEEPGTKASKIIHKWLDVSWESPAFL